MTWATSSKPIAQEARQHLRRVDARVPDVADLEGGHEGEGLATSRARCRPRAWCCGGPRFARGRHGCARVASSRVELATAIAHHVRLRRSRRARTPAAVVHAVAPGRVELHPVGRVGREERRRRPVEQPRDVVGVRGVAAQEPVVAEHVQLARLDVGLLGRLGHLVGVGQASLRIVAGEVAEEGERGPRRRP